MILPDLTGWADDVHSGCVVHAARQRGIPVERIMAPRRPGAQPEPWLRLSIGGQRYFYSQAILVADPDPADSRKAHHVNRQFFNVTAEKFATKRLLMGLGVPVPAGGRFAAEDIAGARAMPTAFATCLRKHRVRHVHRYPTAISVARP